MSYQEDLFASQTIMNFMGKLALRYSSRDMKKFWEAEKEMAKRYGIVFLADAIRKDPKDAELALFRICKHAEEKNEPEEIQYAETRWHHAYPKQKSIAKRLVTLVVAGIIALTLVTVALSQMSIAHSNDVIASADRILEVYGR